MILFKVEGEPVGKGRPRVTARGGKFAHAYTPKKTKEYEDKIRFEFMASTCEKMPVYGKGIPLKVEATIAFSIPQSYSKKKQEQCRKGLIVPTKKPDVDNVLKCVFDALSSYAFYDDAQITEVVAEKVYTDGEGYVEIKIYSRDWQSDGKEL